MQQTMRVARCGDARVGLRAVMDYCRLLCDGPDAPYNEVDVLPHLDHADPIKDKRELTQELDCFCSVMFDAQKYSYEENIQLTKEYVKAYGDKVLVEGAVEALSVGSQKKAHQNDDYVRKAIDYVKSTGVDFLVADLGTEQQSADTKAKYLKHRAQELTRGLGRPMLVLHGTSSLSNEDIGGFSEDGIVRVNMWTRIVREAGQYAARQLIKRLPDIEKGDFEACEGRRYLNDSIDRAAEIMYQVLSSLGYSRIGIKKTDPFKYK
jgi:fructose/tagatose bisphosphate aldolase